MKLHKDGTIEGTPAEIAEYAKLTAVQQHPFKVVDPLIPKTAPAQGNPLMPWTTTISADLRVTNKQLMEECESAKKETLDAWQREGARILFGAYDVNKK